MKCPHCDADVAENVVICSSCGARLGPEDESESPGAGPEAGGGQATGKAAAGEQAASGPATAAEPVADREYPPPWRYSLKDMRIVWLNMLLLTIAMAVVAERLHRTLCGQCVRGQVPDG